MTNKTISPIEALYESADRCNYALVAMSLSFEFDQISSDELISEFNERFDIMAEVAEALKDVNPTFSQRLRDDIVYFKTVYPYADCVAKLI